MRDAVVFMGTCYGLVELIIAVTVIWQDRPAVGRDPHTGRIRAVRQMVKEHQR